MQGAQTLPAVLLPTFLGVLACSFLDVTVSKLV